MRNYYICVVAVSMALIFVSFTQKETVISDQTQYYFEFIGVDGEEDDETKWSQITATEYNADSKCQGTHKGCKIISTCFKFWGPIPIPCCVTILPDGGHKDPITGCGVIVINNKTDNP